LSVSSNASTYSTSSLTYSINIHNQNGYRVSLDVFEILFYTRDLTASERQQVEGYLAWKWGIRVTRPDILPTTITGCQLWLDGNDPAGTGIQPANGASVSTWVDKSGNGRNAVNQATAATFGSNFLNSRGVLQFVGTQNYLVTYPSFPNTAYTIFSVQRVTNNTDFRRMIHGSASGNFNLFVGASAGNVATFTGNGTAWNDTASNTPALTNLNTWRIVTVEVDVSALTPFVNGTSQTSKNGTTAAFSDLRIGMQPGSIQPWIGQNAEIILYNSALTGDQRQQVETYLGNKWGITISPIFPATHPYSSLLPVMRPFVPVDIAGCILWLDAHDNQSMTFSGSNITQWNDKSGGGSNFTSSNNPVLTTINGQQFVDVTSLGFFSNTSFVLPATYSVFAVGFSPTTTEWGGFLYAVPDAVFMLRRNQNANTFAYFKGNRSIWSTNVVGTTTSTTVNTIWGMVNATASGTGLLFGNGTQQQSNSGVTNSTSTGLYLGTWQTTPSSTTSWRGYYGDIVIYNRGIAADERQQIEGYLARKWGLRSGLPSAHPNANIIPSIASFNPRQIPNCAVWLDATDYSTLVFSGSNVTQVRDKSGNGRNAVLSGLPGVVAATIDTTFMSGRPMMNFSNSLYDVTYASFPTAYSIFTVQYNTNNTLGNAGFQRLLNASNADSRIFVGTRFGDVAVFNGNGTSWNDTNTINVTNFLTPRIVEMIVSGSTLNVFTEGNLGVTKTGTTATFNNLWLGYGGTGQDWYGGLGEFIIFSAALTTQQRQLVEGYLARKWGLQNNLPNSHPYKKISPI
jgi:hypothetical protein